MLIDNIIFNDKCHIVALFKDYLIFDDDFEFFKKFHNLKESFKKLSLYFEYYEKYSILYPNLIISSESKYIYKNLHKKQKMLDKQQSWEKQEITKKKSYKDNDPEDSNIKDIFNSKIYCSIFKGSENDCNSIFGLSRKAKEEDDTMSLSLINDIIININNNEKEKEIIDNNLKKKYEYLIRRNNIINDQNKNSKYKIKGNTNNSTKNNTNNTNNSLNTNKSNNFKINSHFTIRSREIF